MTQTNTPKPTPRPARKPSAADPETKDVALPAEELAAAAGTEQQPGTETGTETGTGPSTESVTERVPEAEQLPVPASEEISVVTVSDAQDRTSADSLSAFSSLSVPQAPETSRPHVTAGVFEPEGGWSPVGTPDAPGAEPEPAKAQQEAADVGAADGAQFSERRDRAEGPEPAAALTADRLLNKKAAPPAGGWRLWLFRATFGNVNVGDSDKVRIQRAMEHRIALRLGERTRYVPVLSRKGGVGKTTVTTLLGMVLADLREDRVIAMDANPDRGTLSDRSPGRADFTARQLVRDRFTVNSFAQLSNYTARDGSRLDVLASDTDPMVAHAFDDADYRAVTDILGRYYSIVLTDSGTGMVHSVMKGTLEKADAVVLVSGGSVDEARLASETLSWLEAHGRRDLVARATVVINMAAGEGTLVNIDEIEQHFLSRVRNVVRIPHDRHLAEGSRIDLRQLKPATKAAAVELAALVVDELQQA
ncbi:MinD/ParA family ATP-binding protein [Pseudarthrobacter sp. N5]|uniref:MinD/ParA family ATP-binding protein n=1 Tax=Pseudarthrobacter sp. N5 TaxID=3418416 RepID=UPI003CF494BD